ncbi:MAG: nitroreductase family protein [Acidimicrobiales bacterium]
MEFYDVVRTTPATRQFESAPVPDEVLYRILDHARFAPSGGNRQGWRVVVVKDPDKRRRLRDLYVMAWREYVAHGVAGLVPFAPVNGVWESSAVDLTEARRIERPNPFGDRLDEVPVMLVICVELAALAVLDNGLGRQSIVGGGSVYPFAHNILLGARNERLGGVLTTVICREEPAVMELLGVPPGWAVAGLMALGRPVKEITRLARRPVEELAFVDRFEGPAFTVG